MVLKAAVFKTALGGCYKPTLTELCHLHPVFSLMIVSLFFLMLPTVSKCSTLMKKKLTTILL